MTTKRPVGRPPSGLPKRVRKNINIERDETLDTSIEIIRKVLANRNNVAIEDITKTRAIRYAIAYALAAIPIEESMK